MPAPEPAVELDVDLETLEQEREFLLRSLADLDAEHEAGDIEDDDYRALTDDYTARAALVLRAIEATRAKSPRKRGGTTAASGGAAPRSPPKVAVPSRRRPAALSVTARHGEGRDHAEDGEGDSGSANSAGATNSALLAAALQSRRRWRTAAVVVVVVGFAALASWLVTRSSGTRLSGQTATGNSQLTGSTVTGGIDPRLSQAATDVNNGQVTDALKLYDAILQDDPNQPVALADGGWLEAQAGLSGNRTDLVDAGLAKIAKAEQVDPNFADAHFFRGFLLLRAKNDAPGAVTELRTYLGSVDPTAPQVASVQNLLQEAIKAAGPNVPAGPNAPTTATPAGPPSPASTTKP